MKRAIITASNELHRICSIGAALCFVAMLLFVAIQVIARYVFQEPPIWTEELARYAMVWGGLLGATMSFKSRTDPVLALPERGTGSAKSIILGLFRTAAVIIFLAPVLYYSLFGPHVNLARGFLARSAQRTSDTLGFPMIYVALAVPIAAAVILIHLAARAAGDNGSTSESLQ